MTNKAFRPIAYDDIPELHSRESTGYRLGDLHLSSFWVSSNRLLHDNLWLSMAETNKDLP